MHKFLISLFDKIDQQQSISSLQNQLYLINGNFQDCLGELLERSLKNLDKNNVMRNMNVQFDDSSQPRIIKKSSKEYLESLKIGYDCEWPIEIVIDRLTV